MLRENVGRLAVILAGGGCLALMMFVAWPQLFEPAPPMTPDEIVEEVLGPEAEQPGEIQAGADEMVMPVPSPLVAVRDDGEAMPVVFPSPEGETPEAQETGERGGVEAALPPVLSAEDVAAAAAALEGLPIGEAVEAAEAVVPAADDVKGPEAPAEPQAGMTAREGAAVVDRLVEVVDRLAEVVEGMGTQAEAPEAAAVPVEPEAPETTAAEAVVTAQTDAAEGDPEGNEGNAGPDEVVLPDDDGGRPAVERTLAAADMNSQASMEAPDPSGGLPSPPALEAGQADGPETGLSPRTAEMKRTGVVVPGTLRGVMGYRLPLVSRQEVPDQIVSGVLIPAHTTFVILKAGWWELVDVAPEELHLLMDAAAGREAPVVEAEPIRRGWNPLRMLKRRKAPADE